MNQRMLRIGISSCLLGEPVRYDGGHKRAAHLLDWGAPIEWVPVCPEVEAGLPVPREPIALVRRGAAFGIEALESGADLTDRLDAFFARRASALAAEGLSGFVFKSKSPSCALASAEVLEEGEVVSKSAQGAFARAVLARIPEFPVVEEDALLHPSAREAFLTRAWAYQETRTNNPRSDQGGGDCSGD